MDSRNIPHSIQKRGQTRQTAAAMEWMGKGICLSWRFLWREMLWQLEAKSRQKSHPGRSAVKFHKTHQHVHSHETTTSTLEIANFLAEKKHLAPFAQLHTTRRPKLKLANFSDCFAEQTEHRKTPLKSSTSLGRNFPIWLIDCMLCAVSTT